MLEKLLIIAFAGLVALAVPQPKPTPAPRPIVHNETCGACPCGVKIVSVRQ